MEFYLVCALVFVCVYSLHLSIKIDIMNKAGEKLTEQNNIMYSFSSSIESHLREDLNYDDEKIQIVVVEKQTKVNVAEMLVRMSKIKEDINKRKEAEAAKEREREQDKL